MTGYRKNFTVGITMLLGLVLLGYMIVKFGDAPARLFAADRVEVTFVAPRADGLSQGSGVMYLGVDVGTIERVERDPKDSTRVLIHALLDKTPPLPGNIFGKIRSQLVGGGSSLDLELVGTAPNGEPATHPAPVGQLDASKLIAAEFVGVDVLPPEIGELATELRHTAVDLRQSHLVDNANATITEIRVDMERAGKLVESLNHAVGDPKTQDDLRVTLANFRTTSDNATRVSANLEKFSANLDRVTDKLDTLSDNASTTLTKTQTQVDGVAKHVNDRLEQIARLLDTFQSIAMKIDNGKGTAGLLVNDNKLYAGLVDTSQELKLAIVDLKLMIEQWTQEGVSMRLNGK